ncbi:MAG: hypothetical protein EAZ87_10510 [Nostocales cyanobacterium]|nr:MAG: hypothetical protein EAZ87_10510 [Nostocales cyanobacterium]
MLKITSQLEKSSLLKDNYEFLRKTKMITSISMQMQKVQTNQYYHKFVAFEDEKIRLDKLRKKSKLIIEIRNYLSLPDDWDGYQGVAPQSKTIEETIFFVKNIPDSISLPKPMVSGTGIVGLFWENDNVYAEVCFEGDGTFWYYGTDSDLEIGEESVSIQDTHELPKQLINLIKKI